MPTTTNFSWTTPADTDYVKDGASAIRTLANGIDTSMAQLKGGTAGQILSKTSGTDMAFTWINNDQGDLTAITAGTGISVTNGTGPIPTVAIDTATTVDLSTAQTLTNKKLSDSTTSIVDATDATKVVKFDVTGTTAITGTIQTAFTTAKTITIPDATDTLVGKATTDTLTNKTINGSNNTISNVSLTTGVTGTLPIGNGGTNLTTYTTGDLPYASASNTLSKLAIGTTGQVLTVSGGVPTWAAAAGGGKIAQVQQGSYASVVSSTSSSYADTGLSVSITPSATSSKVLVFVNLSGCGQSGNSSYAASQFKLFRGTTELQLIEMAAGWTNGSFWPLIIGSVAACYLDSPSTTSSTTYKVQMAAKSGDGTAVMNFNYANAYSVTPKSTITVLEVLA